MKKSRKSSCEEGLLPKAAIRWLDEHRTRSAISEAPSPHVKQVLKRAEILSDQLKLPRYSVELFRDLHYLEHPETSIAGLDISDDVFLDLIWLDIYTIPCLQERLQADEISFCSTEAEDFSHRLEMVKRALQAWDETHR